MLFRQVLGCLLAIVIATASIPTGLVASPQAKKQSNSCSSSGSKSKKKSKYEYDYIIVGLGTSGSILARKLSDDKKTKVLVLEAGINRNDDPVILDVGADGDPQLFEDFWALTFNPKYAQTYACPEFGPINAVIYSEGRMWGGSSAHNYTEAARGWPAIYDSWAVDSGNPDWSYNNSLPILKAMEAYTPCETAPNPSQRGFSGPISITATLPINTDPLAIALATASQVGFKKDCNDPTEPSTTGLFNVGFSPFQSYATTGGSPCTLGERSFGAKELLSPPDVSVDGKGLHGRKLLIKSHAQANRVLFKGKKAIGVEYIYGKNANKIRRSYAKKVILCAGSVNSPAILMRSGIGDPAILEPLGIKVLIDNPNVGAHLQIPSGQFAIVNFPTTAFPALHGWVNLSAADPFPAPYNYPDDSNPRYQVDGLPGGPVTVFNLGRFQSHSRGSLQIVDPSPLIQPSIDLGLYSDGPYTTHDTDANAAVTMLKLLAQAVGKNNMILPNNATGAFEPGNEAQLDAYIHTPGGFAMFDHIVGTARMSTSAADGVVDGKLRVFGAKNLMVADNSIFPVGTAGAIPAYMVGYQAAKFLGVPTPPGR